MKKSRLLTLLLISSGSLLLSSCDTDMIEDKVSTTVNNMLPNLWVTLIQLAMFVLIAILFMVFAYKPIKKKLEQRANYIDRNIKDSEKLIKESENKINEANATILASQKKAGEIVSTAQKNAEIKAQAVEKELKETIEAQRVLAHKDIEDERKKMIEEANEHIVNTAIETSKQILKREVKVEDNDKYISDFIDQLNKEDK